MKANILSFSKIIDSTHGAREHYRIPKYQREYTWGKRNWEILLQDLQENEKGYFVGAIIVVKDSDDETHACQTIYEVVDGQQRLTTISLLMLALYEKLSALRESATFEDDDDRSYFETCLVDLRTKLVLKIRKEDDHTDAHNKGWVEKGKVCYLRVQPSSQNDNLDDYRYALGEVGLVSDTDIPSRYGNRRIARGLNFFRDSLPDDLNELLDLLAKINQLQFVFISVGSQADAFTLFETLNNRGVPLSAIDIVKNKMLSEMQKQCEVDVDESFEQWQQIVDALEEPSEQERFLRHFYNAYHWNDLVRVQGINRASKAKIISIYEKIINRNPQEVFDLLCEAANEYGALTWPEFFEQPDDIVSALLDLDRVGASPSYQLLLFLAMNDAAVFAEEDFLLQAINLLRKFYVRRNVTDFPGTSALDQAHVDTIAACQKQIADCGQLSFDFLRTQILVQGKYSTLDEFRESLSGEIYAENTGMARYLLIKLDEEHHTREYAPDLWVRNKSDKYVWTIEHVLPQSERLSKEWIQDLADGDKDKAQELHWEHVNLFGNLTLSGYNSKLSKSSFSKKQSLSGEKKVGDENVAIGYKNKLALNSMPFSLNKTGTSLATTATWNAGLIQARTKHMVDQIVEIFKFDDVES